LENTESKATIFDYPIFPLISLPKNINIHTPLAKSTNNPPLPQMGHSRVYILIFLQTYFISRMDSQQLNCEWCITPEHKSTHTISTIIDSIEFTVPPGPSRKRPRSSRTRPAARRSPSPAASPSRPRRSRRCGRPKKWSCLASCCANTGPTSTS
jgi:hypothetical protein